MTGTPTLRRSHDLTPQRLLGRIFYGTVVTNVDPTYPMSRVQVRIAELHQNIADADLPWFLILKPLFRGNDGKSGWTNIPLVKSSVAVMFDGGNTNSGIVIGELDTGKSRAMLDTGDPNRWGFADENGTQVLVDTQAKTFHFEHQGVTYDVDASGNVVVNIPGNKTETVGGTNTIKAQQHEVDGPVHATDTITDDADVVASGISLVNHVHGGVQSGSGTTAPPQ